MKGSIQKVYIVGAHSRGQTLAEYLRYLYPGLAIEAFLYDDSEKNPSQVGDIQVICLDEEADLHTDYPVYIATRGIYHKRISDHLERLGFNQIYPVTVELDSQLRNDYMEKCFAAMGRQFTKIDMLKAPEGKQLEENPVNNSGGFTPANSESLPADDRAPVSTESLPGNDKAPASSGALPRSNGTSAIYVAMSGQDKPLGQQYALASYEKIILAGAALWETPLPEGVVADNLGENISARNMQFSELTALYWLWKHAEEELIGLVHYRRHFILPQDWAARMLENHVDVILPVPLYVAPNVAENYKARHDQASWDCMMDCLRKRSVQEYEEAAEFFQKGLYCPCNMFIMHRAVLGELCQWLFPVLFQVAEHGGKKEDGYLNRYPGFLSERLMSFFFDKNRKRYKVAYADKNFLQ